MNSLRSLGTIALSILLVRAGSEVRLSTVTQIDPNNPPDPTEGKAFAFFEEADICIDNKTKRIVDARNCLGPDVQRLA